DKESIEDHFDKSIELELALEEKGKHDLLELVREISGMIDIHYIRQKEPKGLGHAISCASSFIADEPFAVLLGDDVVHADEPVIGQMMDVYDRRQEPIIGVQQVPGEDVDKYGIVRYDEQEGRTYRVQDLIEKPSREEAPSNLAILGRYIITPDIFPILEETDPGKGGEIQLTDALKTLSNRRSVYAYNFKGKRYDIGNKMGFLKATVEFALRRDDFKDEFREFLKEVVAE
ncbi:MAG: UTP--glucose-1-phosphate uridylyltransferase, partial [Halanaerobiaceae bacterium]